MNETTQKTNWRKRLAWFIGGLVVVVLAVAAWGLTVFDLPSPPTPVATHFQLEDVTIINPMIDRSEGATLTVADGKVRFAADGDEPVLSEYRGMFVLPGLIDMHSHLPTDNVLKLTAHYGLLNLAHGVTTIREAGDIDGTAIPAARELIEQGPRPFPHVISCGPFVSKGLTVWANTVHIDRPEQADQVIAEIAGDGHGCVKAYEGLTPELIAALEASAMEQGLHVIGHVPVELTVENSGVPDVQHFFGVPRPDQLEGKTVLDRNGDWRSVDDTRMQEIVDHALATGVRHTPTLVTLQSFLGFAEYEQSAEASKQLMPSLFPDVVWNPATGLAVYRGVSSESLFRAQTAISKKQSLVRRLSESGATLHLGTDAGQPFTAPGASLWDEMKLFAEAGVPVEQVWAYATNVAGQSLGTDAGTLTDGGPADFLVFRDDPTSSLDALESLQAVVVRGRLYRKADLDNGIARSLRHYESWPVRPLSHLAAQRTIDQAAANFRN